MKKRARLQASLDAAFHNYLKLTALLHEDLEAMLSTEDASLHWRRNFVRASAALLEGHAHCLRQMCVVGLQCDAPTITTKERLVITDESRFDVNNRLRLTLRVAYKLFVLQPLPNFGGTDWTIARHVLRKRHRLMHPKSPRDLGISDSTWRRLRRGIVWLMKQFFDFLSLSQAKYGS
jgi:hypothetical protein